MCNCLRDLTGKMTVSLKATIQEDTKVSDWGRHPGYFENIMFLASGSRIGLPFVMEYRREKANGGTEVKMSKRRTLVYPSYCPFCGEKTEDVC